MTVDAAAASRPSRLRDLVALTKPGITRMVVLTTGVGMWVAPGPLDGRLAAVTLVGMVLIVAAANALNCYLERDIDALMTRTRDRPLPAGRLDPDTALKLGLGLAAVSVPLLTFGVGPLVGLLSAGALVLYVLVYTPLKTRTPLSTLVGAVPGAIPPLAGWTAVTGRIDAGGLVLFGILFLWQLPHFLAIGIFRHEEYARAGFRILPLEHGHHAARIQMLRYSFVLWPVSLLLVPLGVTGGVYLAGAAVLGLAFLLLVLWGAVGQVAPEGWAKKVFHASLLYNAGLMLLLVIDPWLTR